MELFNKLNLRRSVTGLLGAVILTACSSVDTFAQSGEGIPIMVLGEDSDPKSVPRSSDIFRRVIIELKRQMARQNFYVIDEEMMAAEFGWKVRDRRPKTELIQVADLATQSGNMSYQARAMVTFKIRAMAKDLGFAKKAFVRISGEIYDIQARRMINSFEPPRMEFPITTELTESVGDHARDIASALGDALKKQLSFASRGSTSASTGGASGRSSGGGMASTYTFTFRNFSTREVYAITDVMEGEFTGFVRAREPQGDSSAFKYGYVTKASGGKLLRWVNLVLMDMGLDPDSQVKITKQGTKIEIDKLFDQPAAGGQKPAKCKFC